MTCWVPSWCCCAWRIMQMFHLVTSPQAARTTQLEMLRDNAAYFANRWAIVSVAGGGGGVEPCWSALFNTIRLHNTRGCGPIGLASCEDGAMQSCGGMCGGCHWLRKGSLPERLARALAPARLCSRHQGIDRTAGEQEEGDGGG